LINKYAKNLNNDLTLKPYAQILDQKTRFSTSLLFPKSVTVFPCSLKGFSSIFQRGSQVD